MYVHQLTFSFPGQEPTDESSDRAHNYLCALRMNGQICSNEWPLPLEKNQCVATVLTPDWDSLDEKYNNKYVKDFLAEMEKNGVSVAFHLCGEDMSGPPRCDCSDSKGYVLYTSYVSLEPPIRCLDCFGPVPLYTFPVTPSEEYYEIICWKSDYMSCDSLQMNCAVLEKSTTRQLSDVRSSLSKAGRSVCATLSASVGKPFYYYLYRAHGRSLASEKKRRCPSCGEPWYIDTLLHSRFHFKCDRCLLLSNIAWDIPT